MKEGFEKRFTQGDIVYWCHRSGSSYSVHFGMVDEQFSDAVCIDYLALRERRLVDGVPIDEFKSEERYRKLPKGWTYNTRLFSLTESELSDDEKNFKWDITNPEVIKDAYEKGYLVKDRMLFHGKIEDEITKDGFRVVKEYPMWEHHIDHTSVRPDRVYFTYWEAQREVDNCISEFYRQVEMSDYDWAVEQIDKTLDIWKGISGSSDKEKEQYRDWLLGMKNVEDIEVRIFGGNLQWKYWKNKRWNYIDL